MKTETRYIAIEQDEQKMLPYLQNAFCRMVFDTYREFYPSKGYEPPWIGYFAVRGETVVGVGGYKGSPKENTVEIAYGTVPEFEGKGISSETCAYLTNLALSTVSTLRVTARTLPMENASTSILKKNGFVFVGELDDPEDGLVWEWELGNIK